MRNGKEVVKMDADGDGKITEQEFVEHMIRRLGIASKQELEDIKAKWARKKEEQGLQQAPSPSPSGRQGSPSSDSPLPFPLTLSRKAQTSPEHHVRG